MADLAKRLPTQVLADKVVSRLVEAEKALQRAINIHQVKLVADVAAAQEVFAHRQRLGENVTAYAHQITVHALAKLGELLAKMPKATGGKRAKGSKGKKGRISGSTAELLMPTLADLGIDRKTASVAQQLAALPTGTREAIAQQETTLHEVRRQQRRDDRVERIQEATNRNQPLGAGHLVPVIYADPPWRYEHVKTDNRAIENQYGTLALDEICALKVGELATPDAVLFLWATSPKLAESMQVIVSWGFTYRTCMVWVKDKIGMGYYARQQHELLLIASRGDLPVPRPEHRPSSVVTAPRGDHSEKPDVFYELIERMYPEFEKCELFLRGVPRAGWIGWGNEAML